MDDSIEYLAVISLVPVPFSNHLCLVRDGAQVCLISVCDGVNAFRVLDEVESDSCDGRLYILYGFEDAVGELAGL